MKFAAVALLAVLVCMELAFTAEAGRGNYFDGANNPFCKDMIGTAKCLERLRDNPKWGCSMNTNVPNFYTWANIDCQKTCCTCPSLKKLPLQRRKCHYSRLSAERKARQG